MDFNNLDEIILSMNNLDDFKEALTDEEYLEYTNYLYLQYNKLNDYLKEYNKIISNNNIRNNNNFSVNRNLINLNNREIITISITYSNNNDYQVIIE